MKKSNPDVILQAGQYQRREAPMKHPNSLILKYLETQKYASAGFCRIESIPSVVKYLRL